MSRLVALETGPLLSINLTEFVLRARPLLATEPSRRPFAPASLLVAAPEIASAILTLDFAPLTLAIFLADPKARTRREDR
jgi:hypothetical protein